MKMKSGKYKFNYLIALVLFIALIFSFLYPIEVPKFVIAESSYSGGSGTSSDPFLLSSREDMVTLANFVNSGGSTVNKYYKLNNYIDMGNTNFTPIGSMVNSTAYYFAGTFDGNNCLIINLSIQSNNTNANGDLGLFGYLTGTVKNVRLINGLIQLSKSGKSAGGVVGSMYDNAIVENCSNIGVTVENLQGNYGDSNVGGIAGYNDSVNCKIRYCCNLADITNLSYGQATAGGIVGRAISTVEECYNTGSVSAGVSGNSSSSYAGGICGKDATVTNCFNRGTIKANANTQTQSSSTGSSYSTNANTLRFSTSTPSLSKETTKAYAGGIVGYSDSRASYSYNLGSVSGGGIRTTLSTTIKLRGLKDSSTHYTNSWSEDQENSTTIRITYDEDVYYSGINGKLSSTGTYTYSSSSVLKNNFTYNVDQKVINERSSWSGESTNRVTKTTVYTNTNEESDIAYSSKEVTLYNITTKKTSVSNSKVILTVSATSVKISASTTASWDEGKDGTANKALSRDIVSVTLNRKNNFSIDALTSIPSGFSDKKWAISDVLNDGYPYIMSIFWQGGEEPIA